jgi:polyphosphate kinase 2
MTTEKPLTSEEILAAKAAGSAEISTRLDSMQLLENAILESSEQDAGSFAADFVGKLQKEEQQDMLRDLIEFLAVKKNGCFGQAADMDRLSPNIAKGAYPYVNPYDRKLYKKQIYQLQIELLKLQNWVKKEKKKIVIIFEGRDAAGKGGTIKRFTENLNPRGARIVALPVPNETEKGQWFFQRYVNQLPTKGEIVFFDRSWYNRAVVEPVMGFCTDEQYRQFMLEVPGFEKAITASDLILFKFWLDVGQKVQAKRFRDRKNHPLKRWKLSPVDIAGMDKWDTYDRYIEAMLDQTDMPFAPWTIIRNDDKMRGRLNAIRAVLLNIPYEGRNLKHIGAIDPLIVVRPKHECDGHAGYAAAACGKPKKAESGSGSSAPKKNKKSRRH